MIKKLALGTALFLSLLATSQAQSFTPALTGFCNTFALTINVWEVYGTRSGCGYTVIDGGAVATVTAKKYYLAADTNDGTTLFNWYFTKPNKKLKGNWYLYGSNGTTYSFINSGTYVETAAADVERYNGKKDITASSK
jgi:hypothetical protein